MDELCNQLSAFHISARLQRQAEAEELAAKQDNAWLLNELPSVWDKRLHTPEPGCRPVWEPPALDYSIFEVIIEAQKELNVEEGSKEIYWRVDMMDNYVERLLLTKYQNWIDEEKRVFEDCDNEKSFLFVESCCRKLVKIGTMFLTRVMKS